ncbi:unnamed protein product [Paramecium octaurelia]|uniref:Uncharacterized protein n=1 Tax=Paramecium octaurelia TaxID=43137 RepID=A0A8S1S4B1_PAROT|nr:unnamed protein product [Paramecium octaurelia]
MSLKRQDGRKLQQMRNIEFKLAIDLSVDGSCLYKQGLTEVICLVQGPRAKTQSELLLIEYSVSPFSNIESKRSSKFDKDYSMFAENLKESFENLIILDENGKSEISISVCVIQNDGSSKSAVFNAITLALLDAGVSMKDFLVSVTVGLDQGNLIVDLTQEESKTAQGELTISYQSRKQKIDFYELKTLKLQQQEMDQLSKLAVQKADEIYQWMKEEIYQIKQKQIDQ